MILLSFRFVLWLSKVSGKGWMYSFDFQTKPYLYWAFKNNFKIVQLLKLKFFSSIEAQREIRYSYKKECSTIIFTVCKHQTVDVSLLMQSTLTNLSV